MMPLKPNKLHKKSSDQVIRLSQFRDLVCKVMRILFTILRISTKRPYLPLEGMFLGPCTMIHKKFKSLMLNSIPKKLPTQKWHQLAKMPRTIKHLRIKNSNQLSKLKPKRQLLNSKES